MGHVESQNLEPFQPDIQAVAFQLLGERGPIFIRKRKRGAAGVLAGDFPHREDTRRLAVVGSVKNSADFDPASRETLEPLGHGLADFFNGHHERILDSYRVGLRRGPFAEFRFAHTACFLAATVTQHGLASGVRVVVVVVFVQMIIIRHRAHRGGDQQAPRSDT